jgi:non-ribosomal peptide synthetase component E (peptide arylation enzyme)
MVLMEGAAPLTLEELGAFCRSRHLATQKIPEQIETVAALPRNALGKVLKRELRATFAP